MSVNYTISLEAASKAFFEEAKGKGSKCPCCKRFGKIYRRKLHSSMAAVLILLYRYREHGYVHAHTLINTTTDPKVAAAIRGDFAKLRYWGLIEAGAKSGHTDKKYSGTWRITDAGCDFVTGRSRLFASILLYNSKYLDVGGDKTVDIYEVLGDRFSYKELMST